MLGVREDYSSRDLIKQEAIKLASRARDIFSSSSGTGSQDETAPPFDDNCQFPILSHKSSQKNLSVIRAACLSLDQVCTSSNLTDSLVPSNSSPRCKKRTREDSLVGQNSSLEELQARMDSNSPFKKVKRRLGGLDDFDVSVLTSKVTSKKSFEPDDVTEDIISEEIAKVPRAFVSGR